MRKLVSVKEMRKIETEANAKGLTYERMMENAGKGLAEIVNKYFKNNDEQYVLGLVGSGNNGGDTLVALSSLSESGWHVSAYLARERPKDDPLISNFIESGGEIWDLQDDKDYKQLEKLVRSSDVLLDGVLGTGIKLPLKSEVAGVLKFIKKLKHRAKIVAVDCPSGINTDNGTTADETIPADITVCMAAVKTGLLAFPAYQYVGSIEVVDIGLPESLPSWKKINQFVASKESIRQILPERKLDSHKGTFGTVMIVAGSVNFSGAAMLCARSASRVGAGLVRLAIPGQLHSAIAGHLPEITWLILPQELGVIDESAYEVIIDNLDRVTALLVGPGLGLENTTASFVNKLVSHEKIKAGKGGIGFIGSPSATERVETKIPPMIIDADGLKLLARVTGWHEHLPSNTVLTPHPGEMSVLTGLSVGDIQTNRLEIANKYAQQWGHTLVLKGALTVIASPDGRSAVIPVATSALAHAGTGDVLAGMIVGFRAQGLDAYEASLAAAWIHAHAGLTAAVRLGSTASVLPIDVLASIPEVIKNMTSN
jgi:hydroxyethylthiazole kinase-like uncharacterized protein yjeF